MENADLDQVYITEFFYSEGIPQKKIKKNKEITSYIRRVTQGKLIINFLFNKCTVKKCLLFFVLRYLMSFNIGT